MKPDLNKQRSKTIRSLYREWQQLWNEKRNAPLIKLAEPFQRGYERFFILTESAQARRDALPLEQALQYFQNHQTCRKGYFHPYLRPHRSLKKQHEHHLRRPHLTQLIKQGIPRRLLPYLKTRSIDIDKGLPTLRKLARHQLGERVSFRYPHLVTSYTQPRLITHLPLHDPALESRLQELETILWESRHGAEVQKILKIRYWRDFRHPLAERKFREDFLHQLHEANSDPSIKSAVSPRFFIFSISLFSSALN